MGDGNSKVNKKGDAERSASTQSKRAHRITLCPLPWCFCKVPKASTSQVQGLSEACREETHIQYVCKNCVVHVFLLCAVTPLSPTLYPIGLMAWLLLARAVQFVGRCDGCELQYQGMALRQAGAVSRRREVRQLELRTRKRRPAVR